MLVDINIQVKTAWLEGTQPEDPPKVNRIPSPQAIATSIPADTWHQWFQCWLEHLNPDLSPVPAYALTLRLTDDAEIRSLNATYRHQDCPTDVLAFAALDANLPQSPALATQALELGDIVISVETALGQAREHQHTPQQELAWLASHGLLHLLGWEHPDLGSLEQMLAQQAQLLARVGVQ